MIKIIKLGLVPILLGMVLTSCNHNLRPEESQFRKPNDTLFLVEALENVKLEQTIALIVSHKAADQRIRIYAENLATFQQNNEQKWDSLSKKKNISLNPEHSIQQQKKLQDLTKKKGKKDSEYINELEKQLIHHIDLLQNVSTKSEDNEITTLAITLLSGMHYYLDTLKVLKEKIN